MTDRFPVVSVSGGLQELPRGDNLADPVLAAIAQVSGFTPANIAEVEASTKALRITLRAPDAPGSIINRAFTISHHALGMVVPVNATTAAISATNVLSAGMTFPAVAVLRKVQMGCVTSALSGTRSGLIAMKLKQYLPMAVVDNFNQWVTPPLGTSSIVSTLTPGNLYNSLKGSQPSPLLIVSSLPGAATLGAITIGSKTLGDVTGDASVTVGKQNVPPTIVFDAALHSPYVMGPNAGFLVTLDSPAAGTSQSIQAFVNLCWTEFQPTTNLEGM